MHQLTCLRNTVLVIALALGAVVLTSGRALATPPTGVTTEILSLCNFDELDIHTKTLLDPTAVLPRLRFWRAEIETNHDTDVYVVRVTFDPGGSTGWHTHPGPSLITVVSGTLTAYDSDCTPHVYPAGTCFVDKGDHIHLVRNEGSVPAVDIATQFVPAGFPRRTEANNPGCAGIN
jgi:quercetin dioxygenase-like cupin family protein